MINEGVLKLAKKVLSNEELDEITGIVNGIASNKKEIFLKKLQTILGVKPKRPLYYLAHEITLLPEHGTRDAIKDLGDYIDQLARFTLEDRKFLSKWFRTPLGANIGKLKEYIKIDFYNNLVLLNEIYVRAKHEFNHFEDKSLFNYKDVVHMIFITKKLAKKFLEISERARDYNNEGKTFCRYEQMN